MFKLFFLFLLIFSINIIVFAQTPSETPLQREFGWSLNQEPEKNTEAKNNQNPENKEADGDVIRVETNLVVNDVFVTDGQGRAVSGLKKEDFIVMENGQPQKIETFVLGNDAAVPRSIVLIMDYSVSQLPYIQTSVEAAKTLVDQLNPKDRMAIVTDDIELLTNFTRDKNLLKEKLELLKIKALAGSVGRSEQYSALYAVLNEIFDEEDVRPIVFFQTDGDEDYALKNSGILSEAKLPERKFSFNDVLTSTEKARTTIYTIIPGANYIGLSESDQLEKAKIDNESRKNAYTQIGKPAPPKVDESVMLSAIKATLRRQSYLNNLAKSTGGWSNNLETPQQAGDIYSKILSEINQRYVIGYYPTNEVRDGKRRTVKIEVRGHPEYIILGRNTYFASERVKN